MTGVEGEGVPVDLRRDGVLWLINASVFHPRGYALAVDEHGAFTLLGDGSEPWAFISSGENGVPVDDLFLAVGALLARACSVNGAALDAARSAAPAPPATTVHPPG